MNWVALRMLLGDRTKFLGIVFGVGESSSGSGASQTGGQAAWIGNRQGVVGDPRKTHGGMIIAAHDRNIRYDFLACEPM